MFTGNGNVKKINVDVEGKWTSIPQSETVQYVSKNTTHQKKEDLYRILFNLSNNHIMRHKKELARHFSIRMLRETYL
ncbi:MAG: hypothetical protein DA328_06115 [Nitrososphaeraceae archaeon]|nr:hypothetical protein [Nitrososphaeraceae archaeon]